MTPEQKKFMTASVAAGVLSAAIGVSINRARAKNKRLKDLDAQKSKNAIVVDIDKGAFMRDLPTPTQLAESRGELSAKGRKQDAGKDKGAKMTSMPTADEIEAKKKSILNGRKVNFFRGSKMASPDEDDGKDGNRGSDENPIVSQDAPSESGTDGKDVAPKGERDDEMRLPPRNELGQFTSKTDPTGVEQEEKRAADRESRSLGEFAGNMFFHPFDTLSSIGKNMTPGPVAFAAGGVGAMYLAAILVDKINEIRARRSKSDYESARKEYVSLLQNGGGGVEKSAQWERYTGALIGGAFIIPAVLSAMIANRVMEKRREDKKKEKSRSDSFPEDPIVLYRTSGSFGGEKKACSEEIEISPEAALALISIKRGMIRSMEKDADGDGGSGVFGGLKKKFKQFKDLMELNEKVKTIEGAMEFGQDGTLTEESIKKLSGPEYDEPLSYLAKAYSSGGINPNVVPQDKRERIYSVMADKRVQDALARKFMDTSNKHHGERWGSIMKDESSRYLSRTFGDYSLGGWLKNMLMWFINNTSLGRWFFTRQMRNRLSGLNASQQSNKTNK